MRVESTEALPIRYASSATSTWKGSPVVGVRKTSSNPSDGQKVAARVTSGLTRATCVPELRHRGQPRTRSANARSNQA